MVAPVIAVAVDAIHARLDTGIWRQDPPVTIKSLRKNVQDLAPSDSPRSIPERHMPAPKQGFTIIETMMVVTILGSVVLIGYPRMRDGMTRANVRGARTTLINLLTKARTAATQANRVSLLKITGNDAYVLLRPRLLPGAGNADTLGPIQALGESYGVTVTAEVDSVRFDPRGLGTGFGTGTTFLVSRNGKTETIRVDGLGRVTK